VVTGILPAVPGYVFPHYALFENVQSISSDGSPDAQLNSAVYMLHMAYDTAAGVPWNTTDPTNCIVTAATGLPL
jgi:hypothetical protein